MKKLILVCVVIFFSTFLLWPTTIVGEANCSYDAALPSMSRIELVETNCKPPMVFGGFGGGFKYLQEAFSSGQFVQPESNSEFTYAITAHDNSNTYYFRPVSALVGAFSAVLIIASSFYLAKRIISRKKKV